MKVADLRPAVDKKVRFSLSDQKLVSSMAGCYVLASISGDVLYVGLASNLQRRFGQHREDETKRQAVAGMIAASFHWHLCAEAGMARVERGWMGQYETMHGTLPPMNKVYSPIS
jgi:hypothetical protein